MTKKEQVFRLWIQNPQFNRSQAAADLGINERTVYRSITQLRKAGRIPPEGEPIPATSTSSHRQIPITSSQLQEGIRQEYQNDRGQIDVNSLTIHTLEGALEVAEVDMDKWDVDKYTVNSWQVPMKITESDGDIRTDTPILRTMYQVKVWLKSKIPDNIEIALNNIARKMPTLRKLKLPAISRPSSTIGEMALVDVHMAKLCWDLETGRRSYDLQIAIDRYLKAVETNLSRMAPFTPDLIYFILGQDLMHIENFEAVTPTARHHLDTDTRLPKVYEAAMETTIEAVLKCRALAPVEVLLIPGNHDMHASIFLAHAMKAYFRKDPHITVDNSPLDRKARLHGNMLVGWAHDASSKQGVWANELAQSFPGLWGQSKFREWHTGHKHKKSDTKMKPVDTHGGVLIRQLSALAEIDKWHYDKGFTDAVPGAESFVWSKDAGIVANFMVLSVDDDPK